ncbi:hypothetical protein K440DRAFT_611102 [Wilcoxina mikolae CBS 423.85]|nr:hypothetical protein K440DRAFT_611102 [Wilcoxina mikolae CBS 423.85]
MSTDSQLHSGLELLYHSTPSEVSYTISEIGIDPLRDVTINPAVHSELQSTAECTTGRRESCTLLGSVSYEQAFELQVGQRSVSQGQSLGMIPGPYLLQTT